VRKRAADGHSVTGCGQKKGSQAKVTKKAKKKTFLPTLSKDYYGEQLRRFLTAERQGGGDLAGNALK